MRAFLRVAHRWLGLVLVLPMLWQGITGCFLAVTPIWEDIRPEPAVSAGPMQPASAILAAAAMPGLVPVRYEPAAPGHAAIVGLAAPGQRGANIELEIDPASLAVLGTRHTSVVYRWVHSLHENLLLPALNGRSVVGWFGMGLLLLGLSGVVLWWPAALAPQRWRRAATFRAKAKGARFQRELHGAAGFWFSIMLVVMSLSGVSLAWPQTIRAMLGVPDGPARRNEGAPRGEGRETALDLDAVLQRALGAAPGVAVTDVRLSNPPGRPVNVRMQIVDALEGTPMVMATIDPAGKRVLSVQDPRTASAGALTMGWLRALHFGEAFGLPWRLLVSLCGIALPLLAVTGATLWWLKRRNRLRLAGQRQAALQGAAE
jgi:uncharacterized iron-regulated membrane protein